MCSISVLSFCLTTPPGIRMCEMYNISGETLIYKWEAVHLFGPPRSHFTMDDILELKARCKSDLEKAAREALKSKGVLDGKLSRSFGGPLGRTGNRLGMARNVPTSVKRQDGFAVARSGGKRQPIAGPSKVKFTGPSTDEESNGARSCKSRRHVEVGVQLSVGQTGTCTRRSPTVVLVSPNIPSTRVASTDVSPPYST